WIDKAKRLSTFADDAWQRMACIETANVLDDAVVLQPGQQHLLGVSVTAIPAR
ncbi:D-hexose-6-phosphate mutarotase, partial [Stutzerimonas stutzeri]